jgi:hypothetical protein
MSLAPLAPCLLGVFAERELPQPEVRRLQLAAKGGLFAREHHQMIAFGERPGPP